MTVPTAAEVLDGLDLSGRVAIVTGGYSGLGLEMSRALAARGAEVVVPARRAQAARAALGDVAEVHEMDLGDLESVRAFSEAFLASNRPLDLVIGNAGIMAPPEARIGRGWESQFATNHLGHYALVNRLWPAVRDGARVVMLTSGVAEMRWHDLQFTEGYDRWHAYGQSKTANRLFAARLDQLGEPRGIRAFSVHPGYILTPLQRHLTRAEMVDAGWVDTNGDAADERFITAAQGAATPLWAATSPSLAGQGGLHCEECAVVEPCSAAGAPGDGERLWAISAELTGVSAF